MYVKGAALEKTEFMVIGAVESAVESLHPERSAVFMQLIQTVLEQHKFASEPDSRPAGEAGLHFYADYQNVVSNESPLSDRMLADYKGRFEQAQWVLVVTIMGLRDQASKDAKSYKRLQNVRVSYKLWSLGDGSLILKIPVDGYFYKSNQRVMSDYGSVLENEITNAVYRLLNEENPDQVPLADLLVRATQTFSQMLSKLVGKQQANK